MAHKKAGGSSKNGRDSNSQRRGVKKFGGQIVRAGNIGDTIELSDVLLIADGEEVKIGQPVLAGAKVTARIMEQDKAKKVLIFKKRRRKAYRVKTGHRQPFTSLEIKEISA